MLFPPAPRRVPLSLRIITTLGVGSQVGWAVLGFSSIFFWVFVGNAELPFSFRGPMAMAAGKVTSVERTSASENKTRVMANHYAFSVIGQRYEGVSYTTGERVAPGDLVIVQYRTDDPRQSRIEGMRRKMFSGGVLFVIIFPLIGLAIVGFTMRAGRKRARLLADGVLAEGKLVDRRATNTTVNKRRVYELTFTFTAYDGSVREVKSRTSMTERLEDEALEPLLYSPTDPKLAYMLDEVPARPEVNEAGELKARPLAAFASLIFPAAVIIGNLLAAR
ncbi:MAG TPA: DUF3592 domain-containing protein [Thermoanaerobaculia bacterium]|nr:DUF3592 domain-containing protein [Thermoanaerobaculia bacterium]